MASLFVKTFKNAEGKDENVVYGTVFHPVILGGEGKEKVGINLSVSAGKDQNGQTRYETWNVSLKADDAAKALQEKDRIKITAYCLSHAPYNKETKTEGRVYMNVLEWEKAESRYNGQPQTAATQAPVQQAAPQQQVAPQQQAMPQQAPAQADPFGTDPFGADPFGADPFAGSGDFPNFNVQ